MFYICCTKKEPLKRMVNPNIFWRKIKKLLRRLIYLTMDEICTIHFLVLGVPFDHERDFLNFVFLIGDFFCLTSEELWLFQHHSTIHILLSAIFVDFAHTGRQSSEHWDAEKVIIPRLWEKKSPMRKTKFRKSRSWSNETPNTSGSDVIEEPFRTDDGDSPTNCKLVFLTGRCLENKHNRLKSHRYISWEITTAKIRRIERNSAIFLVEMVASRYANENDDTVQ